MNIGINYNSIIPMRKSPSETSEMTNQILLGELYEIIEQNEKWYHIKLISDNYTGWIDKKMHHSVITGQYEKYIQSEKYVFNERIGELIRSDGQMSIPVSLGMYLPFYDDYFAYINGEKYTVKGKVKKISKNKSKYDILSTAIEFLNSPYLWGGKTALGIDCSGLTQIAYGVNGIALPRDASMQAKEGSEVSKNIQACDLAFFKNEEEKIIHVGLMIDNKRIIHASGKVRIDFLAKQGIFNKQEDKITHQLAFIKRYM